MRVRQDKQGSDARRPRGLRRAHLLRRDQAATPEPEPEPAAVPQPEPAAVPEPAVADDDLFDERRLRASGGPDDRAVYTCTCGYVFEAEVSTSVDCPNCHQSQAW